MIGGKNRSIVYLGYPADGKIHDYELLKKDLPPSVHWFKGLVVHVDLGYQGIESDYSTQWKSDTTILIPFKKKKGEAQLDCLKKAYNKKLSQWRVRVEHAIGGMKRYRILAERIRIKSRQQVNLIMEVCAGLWNFRVRVKEGQALKAL